MQLRYQFRAHPGGSERARAARTFGCVRTVYNDAVAARKAAFAAGLPYPSSAKLQKQLITEAKRTADRAWLAEVSPVPLQQAVRDCDQAYDRFFKWRKGTGPKSGRPRFKRRSHRQSARFNRNAFRLRDSGRLYLAGIGELRIIWSRELPAEPSSVTLIKTPTGKYFVSFVVEVPREALPSRDPDQDTGIDVGLSCFAVVRDGKRIESPGFLQKQAKRIAKAQRVLSRRKKGSKNWDKQRLRVSKLYERTANQRKDFLHKLSTAIIRENQAVYVEDLDVVAIHQRFGRLATDQALGEFLRMIESKAARYGRDFVKVDRHFPSTQLCSSCGALTGPKGLAGLNIRKWTCAGPNCGVTHDRDENAESNLRAYGREVLAAGRKGPAPVGLGGESKRLQSAGQTGISQLGTKPRSPGGERTEAVTTAAVR
ncbi:RNA-guided endonuclease InsQ/TnpB family protein [Glycomyces tritici]|uniref:Transposase n=1 Tax=Glycomyces tritici TaxID=2665176 RepID=A0ABT7YR18_9ACTN|nr:transposase [Glycomyces tritici]MDN3241090.1 transposase [Glycomyces tritici]